MHLPVRAALTLGLAVHSLGNSNTPEDLPANMAREVALEGPVLEVRVLKVVLEAEGKEVGCI